MEKGKAKHPKRGYPKGHFMGIGIAMGIPLGIPLWLSTDNPGMIGAGLAAGVAIGAALEKKYNENPRKPTPEEGRKQKIALWAGVLVLIAGALAGMAAFMMLI